jgi:hypothetical protein
MAVVEWKKRDTERVEAIWAEYTAAHDLSDRIGQAAGIDPVSGRIWFGESASDIHRQMKTTGEAVPLFFVRIGYDSYLRKGRRR